VATNSINPVRGETASGGLRDLLNNDDILSITRPVSSTFTALLKRAPIRNQHLLSGTVSPGNPGTVEPRKTGKRTPIFIKEVINNQMLQGLVREATTIR
jgi:hypothetical protein